MKLWLSVFLAMLVSGATSADTQPGTPDVRAKTPITRSETAARVHRMVTVHDSHESTLGAQALASQISAEVEALQRQLQATEARLKRVERHVSGPDGPSRDSSAPVPADNSHP